jgi:hypothetical protein
VIKRWPTAALNDLINFRDKLANARADNRANTMVADTSKEPAFSLELSPAECTAVIELIDALGDPKVLAKRYWRRIPFPRNQGAEKMAALIGLLQTSGGKPPTDAMFCEVAPRFKLTEDKLKHAYREYVLPKQRATSKRESKSQSEK